MKNNKSQKPQASLTLEDLEAYYNFYMKPTVEEALLAPTDLRKNIIASVILGSTLEYIRGCIYTEEIKFNCQEEFERSKSINILLDVSNSFKHCEILRKTNPSIKHIKEAKQEDHVGFFDAPFDEGHFAEASYAQFSTKDSEVVYLHYLLKDATKDIESLIEKIKSLVRPRN